VIADGGGQGAQVARIPVTGNETVLDAMSVLGGLPAQGSRYRIWIARPAPAGEKADQILPIDWVGITRLGRTDTNYQMLPGDRLFVQAQPMVTFGTVVNRVLQPIEQVFGFALFANSLYNQLRLGVNAFGNNGFVGVTPTGQAIPVVPVTGF
jgi:hypothetical protein